MQLRLFQQIGKSITIILFLTVGSLNFAQAQISVEGGFSAGFNRHTFSVEDESGILQPGLALAGAYGFPVVLKRNKWELHTGFYWNNLSQAFYFDMPDGARYGQRSFSSGISSFKIPLHIGRTLQWTEVTTLSPQIGFAWLTSQRTGTIGFGGGRYGNKVEYDTKSRAVSKNKFMAEAGLDANITVFRELELVLGAHYSFGLQTIEKVDVTYKINTQTYNGAMISKGSGWKFNIGLTLPLYN